VDNSQVLAQSGLPQKAGQKRRRNALSAGLRNAQALVGRVDHRGPSKAQEMIRIGIAAWRV